MLFADEELRTEWTQLWSYLNERSRTELDFVHHQVQRVSCMSKPLPAQSKMISMIVSGNSIAFRISISSEEFTFLSEQLTLRAQTIEAILQDCYGAGHLLTESWFPRRIVAENPSFIRALANHPQAAASSTCYAADLVRKPNSTWHILADRTQTPFGLGYALQNRLVMARSLPQLFEQHRVTSLAPFFRQLASNLKALSCAVQPRIVLLSSESLGDTNYEQAFLARYLDIDLVTAHDLTVRNRQVFTKTLGGLQPVDVIFRWVDDLWCDPLFLRPDSMRHSRTGGCHYIGIGRGQ